MIQPPPRNSNRSSKVGLMLLVHPVVSADQGEGPDGFPQGTASDPETFH